MVHMDMQWRSGESLRNGVMVTVRGLWPSRLWLWCSHSYSVSDVGNGLFLVFGGGGFSLELLMLIIDLRPNIHWLLYSIQSIQLCRFAFSNPIHPFPSPNLSFKYCARIPFLPGDDLTIFTVTLRRSAPCPIDLHRSRDFCRANLRCLEWSVVRILFSSSAACEGGLLGLEVVVDTGNDVPRWEAMKVSLELNALTW